MLSDKVNSAMLGFVKLQKELKLNDTEKYAVNAASVAILIQSWNDADYGPIDDLIFTFCEKVKEIIKFNNQPEKKAKIKAIVNSN
jgi:hypothetical protein